LKAKDRVTGFQGIVTSVTFDLYGCVQCILTPEYNAASDKDQLRESHWFDTKRLELLSDTPVMEVPMFIEIPGGQHHPEFPLMPKRS